MTNEERQHSQASTDGMREPTPAAEQSARAAPRGNETVEQEIQRKGLTAPRVTLADIEANIAEERYFTAAEGVYGHECLRNKPMSVVPRPMMQLTICVLTTRNGFTVTGESACPSPENFSSELGERIARTNAVAKIWPLMGYALRQQLHEKQQPDPDAR